MIKAVIFDYDGVIVNSFINIFEIYKIISKKFDLKIPESIDSFRKMYGYDYHQCHRNIGLDYKHEKEAQEIFNREKLKSDSKMFENIDIVLKILSEKYDLFVVSNSVSEDVNSKLQKYNLTKYFKGIFGRSEVNHRKSEIINRILEEYNLDKDEIISIGDRTIDYDIAREIGIRDENILIVEYGWGYDKDKIKIHYKIEKPIDIIDAIKLIK
ncbi:MAG: HAD-IA family hydrolase [Patescibacteria group bacterium]|nr:HAD-IA family hydrolase [Patescibacteria group bacterium]MDD4304115.1 HAD-IA family hydrolase [Patescibacteria group bacterium]MDD4694992.1 HAD-IA family hydrolase [Patescibacteria group bacterium]